MFQVEDLPSDTQMREILDGVTIEPLREVLSETFERRRRAEWSLKFVTEVTGVLHDGSGWQPVLQ